MLGCSRKMNDVNEKWDLTPAIQNFRTFRWGGETKKRGSGGVGGVKVREMTVERKLQVIVDMYFIWRHVYGTQQDSGDMHTRDGRMDERSRRRR